MNSVIWSTILRSLSMASKFILIVSFAKLLKPAEVGVYGLMVQWVNSCVMLAGMQFFLFSTRSLAGSSPDKQPAMVRDQFVYHGILYLIAMPLFLIIFFRGWLPWEIIGWFYVLVICEHISYELQRILASFGMAVKSNVIHTVRTGAWVYVAVPLMFVAAAFRHINTVWMLWFVASFTSVLMSVYMLRGRGWSAALMQPINWAWIKSGVRVAMYYVPVTATLMIAALYDRQTLDRYIGKSSVGAYTFFYTIANIVVAFPEAGVATVMSPRIIAAYAANDLMEYHRLMRQYLVRLNGSIVITGVAAIIAAKLALKYFVREPIYHESLPVFYILLIANALLTLSLWPHQSLYARHHDTSVVAVSILAVVPYIILNLLMVPRVGIIGAAWANVALQGFTLAGKLYLSVRIKGAGNRQSVFSD